MRGICFFESAGINRRLLPGIVALLFLPIHPENSVLAQKQNPPGSPQSSQGLERKLDEQSQEQSDEVVRVHTDLVQTSVAVFDKRGKFVDNLRAEDFELRIDGKPSPVLFFDRVINGVAGVSSTTNQHNNIGAAMTAPEDRTRTVLFFVDDLHLSAESIARTRKMLSNYIEQEMGENDEAVIASASGQLGFLQQLSSEKEVLRAAVERLKYRPQNFLDTDRPRMTVYQALAIERNDAEVLKYFEDVLLSDILAAQMRQNAKAAREAAERMTRSRAGRLIRQSDAVATQTLTALASAVRSSSQKSGRKLFVFVSDGFLVNSQNPDIRYRLQRITDAAVHAGAVVYTIQASGLNTTFPDASADVTLVPGTGTGRVTGEDFAVQDPLTELAADTGGKALLNANDLNPGVRRALQESNDYYLLAWRPETGFSTNKEFHRIEVGVKGHPDLSVLVQRGFFSDDKSAALVPAKAEKPKPSGDFQVEDLAAAIKGKLTSRTLQTSLMANYLDVPNHGARLSILMQVDRPAIESGSGDKPGTVDVAGVIYNESGKLIGSFVESLKPEKNSESQHLTYLNQFDVKPGLYQVRGATRDSAGLTGMAMQWVKVPDLGSHSLALSSLLIGERELTHTSGSGDALQFQKAQLKIDRRFVQNSRLRFLTFIYNAAPATGNQSPRLSARVDLFQGNKAVVSTPTFAIETNGVEDPARIPYAGEFNLASLPKGHYRMRVTVIDLSAKSYASQEASFEIE
jgi:VWFA-related protein